LVEGDAGGKWSEKVEYARASTAAGMFFFNKTLEYSTPAGDFASKVCDMGDPERIFMQVSLG
jgi:hypothetical protein